MRVEDAGGSAARKVGILNRYVQHEIGKGRIFCRELLPDFFRHDHDGRAVPAFDALRAVVLEGATLGGIRSELVTMAAWTIVPFSVGLRIFKWR